MFPKISLLAGLMVIAPIVGCGIGADESTMTQAQISAELVACHLNDGTIEHGARLHACDPQDQKKTTICHIPPGNPANAHTLCVGNAAVPAHLRNHGDYLGVCQSETPCPPPPGAGGESGGAGTTGSAGATGAAGSPETGSGGTSGGAAGESGAAGQPIIP